jgi:transcriptional regulator with XRE-family HTH domain
VKRPMTAAQRAIRSQGRKQTWIAEKLGISRSDLSRKLSGERRFQPDEITRITELTGLPAELFAPAPTEEVVA